MYMFRVSLFRTAWATSAKMQEPESRDQRAEYTSDQTADVTCVMHINPAHIRHMRHTICILLFIRDIRYRPFSGPVSQSVWRVCALWGHLYTASSFVTCSPSRDPPISHNAHVIYSLWRSGRRRGGPRCGGRRRSSGGRWRSSGVAARLLAHRHSWCIGRVSATAAAGRGLRGREQVDICRLCGQVRVRAHEVADLLLEESIGSEHLHRTASDRLRRETARGEARAGGGQAEGRRRGGGGEARVVGWERRHAAARPSGREPPCEGVGGRWL